MAKLTFVDLRRSALKHNYCAVSQQSGVLIWKDGESREQGQSFRKIEDAIAYIERESAAQYSHMP